MKTITIELTDEQYDTLAGELAALERTVPEQLAIDASAKANEAVRRQRSSRLSALEHHDPALLESIDAEVKRRLDEIQRRPVEPDPESVAAPEAES